MNFKVLQQPILQTDGIVAPFADVITVSENPWMSYRQGSLPPSR